MAEVTRENPLGIRSIGDLTTKGVFERLKYAVFNCDWVFDKPYEKIILFLVFAWAGFSIIKLIFNLM